MNSYLPKPGLHVILFNPTQADRWLHHAYRIPPENGHWRPYQVLIQDYGCTAYTAFYTMREFRRWLGKAKVSLVPYRKGDWCRYGRIV